MDGNLSSRVQQRSDDPLYIGASRATGTIKFDRNNSATVLRGVSLPDIRTALRERPTMVGLEGEQVNGAIR